MSLESGHQNQIIVLRWIPGHTEANSEATVDFHEIKVLPLLAELEVYFLVCLFV